MDCALFELSWEVCNKVGGIYTVVQSKSALINERMTSYFLIGPYFPEKARLDLEELEPPKEFKEAFGILEKEGIICHYGKWSIKGEPRCILVDFKGFLHQKNEIKKYLWDHFKIDSLNTGSDFDDPVVWSWATGKLLELLSTDGFGKSNQMIAHFHEWLAGAGLLYIKSKNVNVKTVFTTHATTLGRTISGSGRDLYAELNSINVEKAPYDYGVQAKHLTEKSCAQNATVFTTVSEITGIEAEKFLGRKPEVLLLNGIDINLFPTMEEASVKHNTNREVMRRFCSYFFQPHYYIDTEKTLFFFIVGRYEMRNKGIDMFIDALARLNDRLKEENFEKNIVTFFWIPRETRATKTEVSLSKIAYDNILHFVDDHTKDLQERFVDMVMRCNESSCFASEDALTKGLLIRKEALQTIKKLRFAFSKQGNPPLSTHDLPDEENDEILRKFNQVGLDNREDDKVKVVFYPVYLNGVDGLLDLTYYDAIMGCHLGVFPSYYEPWGYTPLETAGLGVPAITTDLAGFGRFLNSNEKPDSGIFVLKRFSKTYEESVREFAQILYDYCHLRRYERVQQKLSAKKLAASADWSILVENYIKAYDLALKGD